MRRRAWVSLGGATLLALALFAGSAIAGGNPLSSATVAWMSPSPARLGVVRIALRPGQIGIGPARSVAESAECRELCAATPKPEVAAAIAVIAEEPKKAGGPDQSGQPSVSSSVAVSPPAEAEAPAVEPEPPAVEPEPPAAEAEAPLEEPELPPESPESSSDPGCPLGETQTSAPIAMSLLGCNLIASDSSANPDPIPFWGSIQCAEESRYSHFESGGDPHESASGEAPDPAYRRLTVLDGDDFYGERCELGLNDRETGPTVFYHEGQHRVTYFSERLPPNFPLATSNWQTVMQMKQTQPSDDNCCGPQLEMEARQNHWIVVDSWKTLWEFPARKNVWTRFAWDVYYSQNPSEGWLQVSADLNGDGDFNDPGERSPLIRVATLRTEPEGPNGSSDGLAAGEPIPSHLRVGIYHDPEISCAAPVECSVEVDNVQVMGPSP
jgi:hypothetical protein